MLLTKECDYGIRIIRALADGIKKTMSEICQTEYVPEQYAYKILKKLEHAGLLSILRGRDGGYLLAKPLNTITLLDIITAVDDNLYIFECLKDDSNCPFKVSDGPCVIHKKFCQLQKQLFDGLKQNTIAEMFLEAGGSPVKP